LINHHKITKECIPLSRKNSAIAQAAYGAKYCNAGTSAAVADTIIVLSNAL
jgi:hypothetical protein